MGYAHTSLPDFEQFPLVWQLVTSTDSKRDAGFNELSRIFLILADKSVKGGSCVHATVSLSTAFMQVTQVRQQRDWVGQGGEASSPQSTLPVAWGAG